MIYQPILLKQILICFQFLHLMLLKNNFLQISVCFKLAVTPVHKKNQVLKNLTINQLVYYLKFQHFLKNACINEFQNVLKLCYQNVSLVSEEIIAPKIIY